MRLPFIHTCRGSLTLSGLVLAGGLAASSIGCSDLPACVEEVEVGGVYKLTVLDRWESEEMKGEGPLSPWNGRIPPSCGLTDLAPGMTFTIRLQGDERNKRSCVVPTCPDNFPTDSEPLKGFAGVIGESSSSLCSNDNRKVRLAEACDVGRVVQVLRYDAEETRLTDPPRAGKRPHVALVRSLNLSSSLASSVRCNAPSLHFPSGAELSTGWWSCADVFAVALEKQ